MIQNYDCNEELVTITQKYLKKNIVHKITTYASMAIVTFITHNRIEATRQTNRCGSSEF